MAAKLLASGKRAVPLVRAMTARFKSYFAIAVSAAVFVASCAPPAPSAGNSPTVTGAATAAPNKGGTLTVLEAGEPLRFNSMLDGGVEGNLTVRIVQDPLIAMEPGTKKLIPGLAESWTVSQDGKQYTFNLRKNVKFSDGTPFTADDVVYTFNNLACKIPNCVSVSAGAYGPFIDSVTATDPSTVVVKLTNPWLIFPELLALDFSARIVSKAAAETAGKEYGVSSLVGTGAFMLSEWVKGDHWTLVRNPNYWGQPAYLDQIVFRKVPDGSAQLVQTKAGQADVVVFPPLDQLDAAASDPSLNVVTADGNPIVYFRMNLAAPPFTDLNVRQAMFYGINADAVRKTAYGDYAQTATDYFPPWLWAHDASFNAFQTNADKAKAALAAAGYGPSNPLTFDLDVYNQSEFAQIATLIQAQLKAIGVQANVKQLDVATLTDLELASPPKYQAAVNRYTFAIGSTDDYIWKMFDATSPSNREALNTSTGLAIPDIQKSIEQARVAVDQDTAKKLFRQVQDQLATNAVLLPLAFKKNVMVTSKRVHGLAIPPDFAQYKDVWLDQ